MHRDALYLGPQAIKKKNLFLTCLPIFDSCPVSLLGEVVEGDFFKSMITHLYLEERMTKFK